MCIHNWRRQMQHLAKELKKNRGKNKCACSNVKKYLWSLGTEQYNCTRSSRWNMSCEVTVLHSQITWHEWRQPESWPLAAVESHMCGGMHMQHSTPLQVSSLCNPSHWNDAYLTDRKLMDRVTTYRCCAFTHLRSPYGLAKKHGGSPRLEHCVP